MDAMIPGQEDRAGDQAAHGVGSDADDSSREVSVLTVEARRVTSTQRHTTAGARDVTAHERDLLALRRDQAAEVRDRQADECDAEIAALTASGGEPPATGDARSIRRAARDRQRAASDRARSAAQRASAGEDRDQAARDRALAAGDRALAAEDRAQATAEREADEVDMLTGARRRAPGLAELQRTIDRARRGSGQLIAAYVDVNDLKATNDSKGHHAGDVMLKHIVEVLQTNLRSYEPVVRLGGDEFVCTISDTTMESARQRFDEITAELSLTPDDGSITVGFAELERGDSPMDLIDRADSGLIESRNSSSRKRRPVP
jgi:diguanylate cyclase (GGDEF)-like protein